MIFGNIQNLGEYPFLEEQIKECFAYAKEHDLMSYEKGSHEIDGDRLFVNVVEYTTTTAEERFWEAHRQYLDLHLMLRGTEQIDLNFIQNMDLRIPVYHICLPEHAQRIWMQPIKKDLLLIFSKKQASILHGLPTKKVLILTFIS